MTAQVGDIYKYENRSYTIVAMSNRPYFDPADFGLEAHASSTACYRGYWCEYAVVNDTLILQNLFLHNQDKQYPTFCNIDVSPEEFTEHTVYIHKRTEQRKVPKYMGHRVYENVNLQIPYTGKLLLGDDFIQEYYIHMGFQRAWAYRELIELVFEEGLLVEYTNLNHMAQAIRDTINQDGNSRLFPDLTNLPKFIDEIFSLDYAAKAWWLPRG